jgi:hypothetical protein
MKCHFFGSNLLTISVQCQCNVQLGYISWDLHIKKQSALSAETNFIGVLQTTLSVIVSGLVAILFPLFVFLQKHGALILFLSVCQNGGNDFPEWWRQIPPSQNSVLIPNFLAGVLRGARDRHVQNRFSMYWPGCQSSMRYQKVPGDMVQTTNNKICISIHL